MIPVKSFPETPVYDISSVPTLKKFVPEVGKLAVLVNVTEVPDPPVPNALSPSAPLRVVVIAPAASPPQDPKPQPKPFACTAGPTV